MLADKANWNKSRIISVQNRSENDLLESTVEVILQRFNFQPYFEGTLETVVDGLVSAQVFDVPVVICF